MSARTVDARAGHAIVQADRAAGARLMRVIAVAGTVLMAVVVAASAYLRLAHAGGACPEWPACGEAQASGTITIAVAIARTAHRLAASAVGILLIALLVVARTQRPRRVAQARLAAAGLAIAIGLALLGTRMTSVAPGSAPPLVNLANLAGGFALLAIMATSWAASHAPVPDAHARPAPAPVRAMCVVSLTASALTAAFGALASSGVVAMQMLHHASGWLVVAVVAVLLLVSRRAPASVRGWRGAMVAALLAVSVPGVVEAYAAPSLAVALAHNLAAAALVAVLAGATYRSFAAPEASGPAYRE